MALYEEVEAYGQRLAAACHALDAEALFHILDPECVLLNPGEPTVVGREKVVERFVDHATPPPLVTYAIHHYVESGDLVVAVGSLLTSHAGEPLRRFLLVYRRRPDGSLALLVDAAVAGP